ncbi:MAG: hypothetical protein V1928_05470 [Parcubacteria group bacterium]
MNKEKKKQFAKAAAVLAFCLIAARLSGCARGLPDREEAEEPGDLIAPIELSGALADTRAWPEFPDRRFHFLYPAGWRASVTKMANAGPGLANYRIRLQSVNKEVVFGAAAPDDYYIEQNGLSVFNAEKYALEFAAIDIDVYDRGDWSWAAFFREVHPEVVEFKAYSLPARPELEAVFACRVSGIHDGRPRFFIRAGGAVYDIALFCAGDCADSESILSALVARFPFLSQ